MENMQNDELTLSPYQVVANVFRLEPRLDLTLRLLSGGSFKDADCMQSLFIDSLLRDNEFKTVVFSRSDFQGARVEGCSFSNCNFRHCDFRSATFSRCRFDSCDFTIAVMSDCEFMECEFVNCKIEQATLTDCLFEKTNLIGVSFEKSSVVLNTFRQVGFDEVKLGNCTFLFNVTRSCTFTGASINAESVGYVFGLDVEALSTFDFLYLGKDQGRPDTDLVELLEQQYAERRWDTGLVVMALNFGKLSTAAALPMLVEKMVMQARLGVSPKKDEVRFVERMLLELQTERAVPLLAASGVADAVVAYLDDATVDERVRQRLMPTMQSLLGTANSIILQMLADLDFVRRQLEANGMDQPQTLKITYRVEPTIAVADLINQAVIASGCSCSHQAYRIRTATGSFVEFIQTCAQGTLSLMATLYAVEGCIVRLTTIKARYQVLVQKTPPKQYRQLALSPKMGPQTASVREVANLLHFLKPLEWLRSGQKSGFSKENIEEIERQD